MGSWVAVNSWDKERGGGKKTNWFLVFTPCRDFFFFGLWEIWVKMLNHQKVLCIYSLGEGFKSDIKTWEWLAWRGSGYPGYGQSTCVLGHFSCIQLFATPWTVTRQAPLSTRFSRQEYEWVAMPSSRGTSWPRDGTRVSCSSCTAGRFFTTELPGKPMDRVTPIFLMEVIGAFASISYMPTIC